MTDEQNKRLEEIRARMLDPMWSMRFTYIDAADYIPFLLEVIGEQEKRIEQLGAELTKWISVYGSF